MAGFVDSLVISIGLDPSKLEQGLAQVGQKLDAGLRDAVDAASPAVDGLGEALSGAAEKAEELGEAAAGAVEKIGEAGEKASEAADGAADGVADAMQKLGVRSEAAIRAEMEKVKAAYEAIRASAALTDRDKAVALENARRQLERLENELKTKLPQAAQQGFSRMDALAARARGTFQNLWAQMVGPLMGVLTIGGAFSAYLKNVTAEERDFSIYTHKDAEEALRFQKNLEGLKSSADALFATFARHVMPALNKLAEGLKKFVDMLRQHPEGLAAAASVLGAALALKLLPPLKQLPKLIAGVGKAMLRWIPFIGIVMAIAAVVDDFVIYLEGGESALDDFWAIFGTGEEISKALSQAWKDLKKAGSDMLAALGGEVRLLWQTLTDWGVIAGLKDALLGIGHVIHGVFTDNWKEAAEGAKQLAKGIWDALWGAISGVGAEIGAYFSKLWADIKTNAVKEWDEYTTAIWTAITGVVDRISAWIKEKWNAVISSLPVPDFLKEALGLAGPETEEAGGKVKAGMAETAAKVKGGFDAAWTATANFAVTKFNAAAASIKDLFSGIVRDAESQADRLAMGAGAAALHAGGLGARGFSQAQAQRGGGHTDASVHIGRVQVQTQAKDADGIARDMGGALRRHKLVNPAAAGMHQK